METLDEGRDLEGLGLEARVREVTRLVERVIRRSVPRKEYVIQWCREVDDAKNEILEGKKKIPKRIKKGQESFGTGETGGETKRRERNKLNGVKRESWINFVQENQKDPWGILYYKLVTGKLKLGIIKSTLKLER